VNGETKLIHYKHYLSSQVNQSNTFGVDLLEANKYQIPFSSMSSLISSSLTGVSANSNGNTMINLSELSPLAEPGDCSYLGEDLANGVGNGNILDLGLRIDHLDNLSLHPDIFDSISLKHDDIEGFSIFKNEEQEADLQQYAHLSETERRKIASLKAAINKLDNLSARFQDHLLAQVVRIVVFLPQTHFLSFHL
jgi:hypothetical protein